MVIPGNVANAAQQSPLPLIVGPAPEGVPPGTPGQSYWATPIGPDIDALDASFYGGNAAHRRSVLKQLPGAMQSLEEAQQRLDALESQGVTGSALTGAEQSYHQAYAVYEQVFNAYVALPEEADAWATASIVRQYWP